MKKYTFKWLYKKHFQRNSLSLKLVWSKYLFPFLLSMSANDDANTSMPRFCSKIKTNTHQCHFLGGWRTLKIYCTTSKHSFWIKIISNCEYILKDYFTFWQVSQQTTATNNKGLAGSWVREICTFYCYLPQSQAAEQI